MEHSAEHRQNRAIRYPRNDMTAEARHRPGDEARDLDIGPARRRVAGGVVVEQVVAVGAGCLHRLPQPVGNLFQRPAAVVHFRGQERRVGNLAGADAAGVDDCVALGEEDRERLDPGSRYICAISASSSGLVTVRPTSAATPSRLKSSAIPRATTRGWRPTDTAR